MDVGRSTSAEDRRGRHRFRETRLVRRRRGVRLPGLRKGLHEGGQVQPRRLLPDGAATGILQVRKKLWMSFMDGHVLYDLNVKLMKISMQNARPLGFLLRVRVDAEVPPRQGGQHQVVPPRGAGMGRPNGKPGGKQRAATRRI